jgi:hypothetical protein
MRSESEALPVVERARSFIRWRYPIIIGLAVLFAIATPSRTGVDWDYFQRGSELLFGQHRTPVAMKPGGLHLYANYPVLQIGPLSFLVFMPFRLFGEASREVGVFVLTAAGVALIYYLEQLAKRVHDPTAETRQLIEFCTLLGGSAAITGWYAVSSQFMHLDDVLVLTFGCMALSVTARGRTYALGVLIGLGVAAKPTGLIMLPLVLQLPRREWWKPVVIAGAFAALAYLPFILADAETLSAFRPRIVTSSGSVLRVFGIHEFGWVRPAQLVGAFAAGSVAVWRGRWPAVLLVGIAVRMALDPGAFEYYTSGLILAALAWDLLRSARPVAVWSMVTFWFLVALGIGSLTATTRGVMRLAVTAAVVGFVCIPRREPQPFSARA